MKAWEDRQEVKLGNLGELLYDEHLRREGNVVVYKPTGGPHPFDRLCATTDKSTVFVGEVKTKPARRLFPDTGLNLSQYEDYTRVRDRHNLRVFLAFVDHDRQQIYGNWLDELEKTRIVRHEWIDDRGRKWSKNRRYPLRQPNSKGVMEIYFPLEAMDDISDLTDEAVARLASLSQRSEKYRDT